MTARHDPFEMYCFASLYQDGSMAISDQMLRDRTAKEDGDRIRQHIHSGNLLIPSTILLAFSLEILLKCILAFREIKIPFEHKLKLLFNSLPDGDKCRIQALFIDAGNEADFHREMTIDSVLERMNNYFEYMRYGFERELNARLPVDGHYRQGEEGKVRGVFGLSRAVVAVQEFIREVNPDWEQRYQQIGSLY